MNKVKQPIEYISLFKEGDVTIQEKHIKGKHSNDYDFFVGGQLYGTAFKLYGEYRFRPELYLVIHAYYLKAIATFLERKNGR